MQNNVDVIIEDFLNELQQRYRNNKLYIKDHITCGPLSGIISYIEVVDDLWEPRRNILGNFGKIIIDFGIVEVTVHVSDNEDLKAINKCNILKFSILLMINKTMEICVRGIGDVVDIVSSKSHLTNNPIAERHMLVFRCGGTKLRKIDIVLFVEEPYQDAFKRGILEKDLVALIMHNCSARSIQTTQRVILFTEDYAVIFDIKLITIATKTKTVYILALYGNWVHSLWLAICPADEVVTSQHIFEA